MANGMHEPLSCMGCCEESDCRLGNRKRHCMLVADRQKGILLSMKRFILLTLLGMFVAGAGACTSTKPLQIRYYRKNIIVKADETIWTNGVQIKMDQLRAGLVAQMIFNETPIVVHFHKDLTREAFDRIMGKLKSEGYKNYDCTVYRD